MDYWSAAARAEAGRNRSASQASTTPPRDPASAPNDELGYAADLSQALAAAGINGKGFIIDTGRNGKPFVRTSTANWCNIKGAGLGERPVAAPAPLVDAYLYIKVPGESDGTSDAKAARFDKNCASDDASAGAPEAGEWSGWSVMGSPWPLSSRSSGIVP